MARLHIIINATFFQDDEVDPKYLDPHEYVDWMFDDDMPDFSPGTHFSTGAVAGDFISAEWEKP